MTDTVVSGPPETIKCAICGREVRYERSRLFWVSNGSDSGTFRTCMKGNTKHGWNGKKYVL